MGFVVAAFFLAVGIVSLVTYNATPHGGPTTSCGPITAFDQTFTVAADCRYISVGELAIGGLFIFLAILVALASRPRGSPE